uniref:Uncharacterized protein n=1 Tax=Spongospora subterranea TaxID=70186 RepID=A0A0H5QJC5_9EUKA|eukprot:CRZ02215.1 hypothetical protein [Spongospora subterranea]
MSRPRWHSLAFIDMMFYADLGRATDDDIAGVAKQMQADHTLRNGFPCRQTTTTPFASLKLPGGFLVRHGQHSTLILIFQLTMGPVHRYLVQYFTGLGEGSSSLRLPRLTPISFETMIDASIIGSIWRLPFQTEDPIVD